MNASIFPVLCVLVVLAFVLAFGAWRLLVILAGIVSHEITMRRLTRILGSRARANRLVRAVELETRNNALSSLAAPSVQSRTEVPSGPVGRPAAEGVSRHPIGATFPHLMFARRQAD